jgi:hypothetical protein
MLLEFPQAADLVGWHLVALYPTVNCIATHAEVGSDRINREPTVRHDECGLKSAFSYYSRLGRSKSHEITLHLCFVKFGQNVRISSHMKWKTPILGLRTGLHLSTRLIRVIVVHRRKPERLRCKTNCFNNYFLHVSPRLRLAIGNT